MISCRRSVVACTAYHRNIGAAKPFAFPRHKHTLPDLRTLDLLHLPFSEQPTLAYRGKYLHNCMVPAYDYNALEPIISSQIMKLHHSKHHQAYVTNLNVAEDKYMHAVQKQNINQQISLLPALKFNGGGHINHSIFWTHLCPPKQFDSPKGQLLDAINKDFGDLDALINKLNAQSVGIQGSGWGWLGFNKETQRLQVATTANQDPLEPTTGLVPLLGIDVWEHAYYLDYKNGRPDYLKAIWSVIDWNNVAGRYQDACSK